jgi:rhamnose utilization protein RhaD (predicted bifunctional aldolase and dehydrogenase)
MSSTAPRLDELADVSARIGNDPLLVQGPGGNSSLKCGDELWVKASGVWLSQARQRPIFTGLALAQVRAAIAAGVAENFDAALLASATPPLRPSIETALHALLPHAAVLHAHAVNSMAISILADGRDRAAAGLDGRYRWTWIPYRQPGAALAAAIAEAVAQRPADVLILQNHGIVVGADTPLAAEARLRDVESRLALPVRHFAAVAGEGDGYPDRDYVRLPEFDGIATDRDLCAALAAAPWFPDQIVFMGGAVPIPGAGESVAACAQRIHAATGVTPALMLVPGTGGFARRDRTPSAAAVITGLYEVARRLPRGVPVIGLPDGAAAILLGWDAEAYRLGLAATD